MAWLASEKTLTPVSTKTTPWTGGGIVTQPHVSYNKDWSVDRTITDAMEKVTWVYRAVQAIASNAARIPLVMRKGNAYDGLLIENHPLDHVFNSRANPGESSYVFRYRVSSQLLLSPNGVFIELVKKKGSKDIERMDLLPPQYVKPIPDEKDFVKYYHLQAPVVRADGTPGMVDRKLKPEQVIWIRNPHPFDPYKSLTPLAALGLAIETDWYAKMYNRNFLLNDGRPGGMVVIKGDATEEDRAELSSRFRGNGANAGRITVITSADGADFVDTAVTPRDAQYVDTRNLTKEEILIGFGVPESVLSNAAGRTFDNADIERLVFWYETMIPHLELITRELDVLDGDESKYVSVDLDRVDVLQRADMKRKEFMLREVDTGVRSPNEYREESGKDSTGTPQGDVLFRTNTKLPYTTTTGKPVPSVNGAVDGALPVPPKITNETANRPPPTPQVNPNNEGKPQSTKPTLSPDHPPTAAQENNDTAPKPLPSQPKKPSKKSAELEEKIAADQLRWEAVIESTVERFLGRQKRVVSEKLSGQKMRSMFGQRVKDLDKGSTAYRRHKVSVQNVVDGVYDLSVWQKQLADDLTPIVRGFVKEYGEAVAVNFEDSPEVFDTIVSDGLSKVNSLTLDTAEKISSVVAAGAMENETGAEMVTRLDSVFNPKRWTEVLPDFDALRAQVDELIPESEGKTDGDS